MPLTVQLRQWLTPITQATGDCGLSPRTWIQATADRFPDGNAGCGGPGVQSPVSSTATPQMLPAQRSLTYGTPIAFGATARPMKPASRTTVRM